MLNWLRATFGPSSQRDSLEQSVASATNEIRAWLIAERVPIHRIETVAVFETWSNDLAIWFFYDTDQQRDDRAGSVYESQLANRCRSALIRNRFPARLIDQVAFVFDSHETVVRDYNGSYFFRLR